MNMKLYSNAGNSVDLSIPVSSQISPEILQRLKIGYFKFSGLSINVLAFMIAKRHNL